MIKQAIKKISEGLDLTEQESFDAISQIMTGQASDMEIAAFLTGLRVKGETSDEITGGVRSLAAVAVRIRPAVAFCVDPVGTGGDGTGTLNISSSAALVAAAAGACVAKHGNRSVSSSCGSADFFESLGLDLTLTPAEVQQSIELNGFGFMFAPLFHPAMRYAAPVRRHLGIRTLFNLLGPLTNPAGANGQVLGVYSAEVMPFVADTLLQLGIRHAMVVHGSDHSDEITITGPTRIYEIKQTAVTSYSLCPEDFGLARAPLQAIHGGKPDDNARIMMETFGGQKGPIRDVVLLNAAATLYVGQIAESMQDGMERAARAIDQGDVLRKIEQLRQFRHQPEPIAKEGCSV